MRLNFLFTFTRSAWARTALALIALSVPRVALAADTNPCTAATHNLSTSTFPLIPDVLLQNPPQCNPSLWNINVVSYFGWKAIFIIDWLAGAAGILLFVYGGILYITAYMSEGNVKRAKSILQAAVIGLVIVVLARYIIAAAMMVYSNQNFNDTLVNQELIRDATPTPAPNP